MTRLLTIIALLAIVLGGSSCGNFAEAVSEALVDSIMEVWTAQMAHVGMTLGVTVEAFHLDKGRWPRDRDELVEFCRENGWQNLALHLERYEEVSFEGGSEGSVQVNYIYGGDESEDMGLELSGSLKFERFSSKKGDSEDLMELLGGIDQSLAKMYPTAPDWLARREGL